MRLILMLGAVALALAGCTSAESAFTGSPHGYSGRVNTIWTDLNVVPTILQPGESALQSDYGASGQMRDMPSTYEVDRAGNMRATGVAAYIGALSDLCRVAPQTGICGGDIPF